MIRVHEIDNPFEARVKATSTVPKRFARISSLAPTRWRGRFGLAAYRNGLRAELTDLAFGGDHVTFLLCPTGLEGVELTLFLVKTSLLVTFSVLLYALRPKLRRPTNPEDRASPLYSFEGIQASRTEGLPIPRYYGRHRAGGQIVREFTEDRGDLGSWYNVVICYGYGPAKSIAGVTSDTLSSQPLRTNGPPGFELPAGIFINETEATQFADVEAHIRLGSVEQESIPGFDQDVRTIGLTRDLSAPETTSLTFQPFVSLTTPGTSEDSLWAEHGQYYDVIDQEIDAFTVKLRFPQGIGYQDPATGSWFPLQFALAVRYIELDNSNNPITTGGPQGDGYVRLRPTQRWGGGVQGDVRIDYTFRTFNPQTFTLPTQVGILKAKPNESITSDASSYAVRASSLMDDLSEYPNGWNILTGEVREITVMGWVALRPNGTSAGYNGNDVGPAHLATNAPILSWFREAAPRGFDLLLAAKDMQIEPGQLRKRVVPIVRVGNGTSTKEYYPRNRAGGTGPTPGELGDTPIPINVNQRDDPSAAVWYHIAFAYKADASGTNDRLRIFVDGEIVFEHYASIGLCVPLTTVPADMRLGSDMRNTGTTDFLHCFRGWMAEVGVWNREFTPAEIEARFNNRQGMYEPAASVAQAFAFFHFGENYPTGVSGNGATILDSSPGGTTLSGLVPNNLTISLPSNGSPSQSSSMYRSGVDKGFIDRDLGTNTQKRSKYRIEVMRATRDYTKPDGIDEVQWEALQLHVDQHFRHPECVLLALRIKAQEQLAGAAPRITAIGEWSLVRVWDGVDPDNPHLPLVYSQNPAWIAFDLCTHTRGGMGSYIRDRDVDLVSTLAWAQRNDEWVYDLRGNVLEVHSTDSSKAIREIGYNSLGGHVSSFFLLLRSSFIGNVPRNYKVGGFVGFTGLPTPGTDADVQLDMNLSSFGAWEIVAIDDGVISGNPRIYLKYDFSVNPPYPWTSGGSPSGALSGVVSSPLTGTVRGVEVRNRFDGGFDEAESGWDALIEVCDASGAAPMRSGSKIFFLVDGPRDPIDLVTVANIQKDSFEFEYLNPRAKDNALDVDILDEEINWDRTTVHDEHPSVTGTNSLSDIRTGQARLRGVTRRSQAKRWAREKLNQNALLLRAGKYTASIDALPHEPMDVLLVSHDLMPGRGRGGRVLEGSTTTDVLLDRPMVIESGKTYTLAVRSAVAPGGSTFEARTVTNAAGTYSGLAAEPITVSGGFSLEPQLEDLYALYEAGTELPISIRSIGFTRDLRREIAWLEHSDEVYIVDGTELPDLDSSSTSSASAASSFSTDGDSQQLPDRVEALEVRQESFRASSGAHGYALRVSWQLQNDRAIREQIVWIATVRGAWREGARVGPGANSALIQVPRFTPGTTVSVAVQVVTRAGARREIEACGARSVSLSGVGSAPDAPDALAAAIVSERAVYSWQPSDDAVAVEVRRGGWILGLPVAVVPAESSGIGPTLDFVTVPASNLGALIVLRARNGAGSWSPPTSLRFAPSILDATSLSDVEASTLASQEWSEFGDGWIDDAMPDQNGELVGLRRRADGALEFDGSDLTGTYTAAEPLIDVGGQPEDVHLSATCEARQRHPLTWSQMTWAWNDPAASQWSWEGPIKDVGDGQDARCTLAIEVRFLNRAREWGPWSSYRPGRSVALGVQFRIVVTRPSTNFDVRVTRFATELIRRPTTKFDREDLRLHIERLNNGPW